MIELLRDGPWRKLLRGDKHITALVEARRVLFGGESPVEFVHSVEQDESGTWWDVQRYRSTPDVSPDLALIAGDAMHNLRSALDHLVGALVRLNNGTITSDNEFPIWDKEPTGKKLTKTLRKEKLGGIRADHRLAIERLLPYKDLALPRSKLLLALHRFDVVDKHKFIHPSATAARDPQGGALGEGAGPADFRFTEGPIEAVREQMRVRRDSKVPVGFRSVIDLEFGDPPMPLNTMLLVLREVQAILDGFIDTFSASGGDDRV